MTKLCKIDHCERRTVALGLCNMHYIRHQRARAKDRDAYPRGEAPQRDRPAHRFAEAAAVYDGDDCLIWPFTHHIRHYGTIRVDGRSWVASRYICTLAHGEPPTPKHHAAHSCNNGKGGCVNARHLSWKTPHENAQDRSIAGTCGRGQKGPRCKLDERQVYEIRRLKGVETAHHLAARYGISLNQVWKIQRQEAWAWLPAKAA